MCAGTVGCRYCNMVVSFIEPFYCKWIYSVNDVTSHWMQSLLKQVHFIVTPHLKKKAEKTIIGKRVANASIGNGSPTKSIPCCSRFIQWNWNWMIFDSGIRTEKVRTPLARRETSLNSTGHTLSAHAFISRPNQRQKSTKEHFWNQKIGPNLWTERHSMMAFVCMWLSARAKCQNWNPKTFFTFFPPPFYSSFSFVHSTQ